MSGGGNPGHGVKVIYENVKVVVTGGVVTVTVKSKSAEVSTQISQETGVVVGNSVAPADQADPD